MSDNADIAAQLTTAYNAIFDVKDTLEPGSDQFVLAHNALHALGALMFDLRVAMPVRYDATR